MDWFWRKVDVLIAAAFVAAGAIGASQGYTFMSQYEERLSRDLEQARARVTEIKTGLRYRLMSDIVRTELETTAQTRFDQLNAAHGAISGAGPVIKPYALMRYREPRLLAETEAGFTPRMPAGGGLFYAILGALLAFAAYEIIKFPVMMIAQPRQRKFRRRG